MKILILILSVFAATSCEFYRDGVYDKNLKLGALNTNLEKKDAISDKATMTITSGLYIDPSSSNYMPLAPTWLKDAIFYGMRLDRFNAPRINDELPDGSLPGTFESAILKLDHLKDLGATAIILNPIMITGGRFDTPEQQDYPRSMRSYNRFIIYYSPNELTVVDPWLSSDPYAKDGGESFKKFVQAAHQRNIKVILDVVPSGVYRNSSLINQYPVPTYPNLTPSQQEYEQAVNNHPDYDLAKFWDYFSTCPGKDPGVHCLNTNYYISNWGRNYNFNFQESKYVRETWVKAMVDLVKTYDIDGFRCDLEPFHTDRTNVWYSVARNVQINLNKSLLIMAESPKIGEHRTNINSNQLDPNFRWFTYRQFHLSEYDFGVKNPHHNSRDLTALDTEGNPTHPLKPELEKLQGLYYTSTLSSTNNGELNDPTISGTGQKICAWDNCNPYSSQGRLFYFAYGNILSPLLPNFFMGEEFNNPYPLPQEPREHGQGGNGKKLYFTQMDWLIKSKNLEFYKNVRRLLKIRKDFEHIIAPLTRLRQQSSSIGGWAKKHFLHLNVHSGANLSFAPYAMYYQDEAIIVIGHHDENDQDVRVKLNFEPLAQKIGFKKYHVNDLMAQKELYKDVDYNRLSELNFHVPAGGIRVLRLQGSTEYELPVYNKGEEQYLSLGSKDIVAQDFSTKGRNLVNIKIKVKNLTAKNGSLKLALYLSDSSYQYDKTVKKAPLFSRQISVAGDEVWVSIYTPYKNGHFLLTLSSPNGDVGIFVRKDSTYGGTFFLNGKSDTSKDIMAHLLVK